MAESAAEMAGMGAAKALVVKATGAVAVKATVMLGAKALAARMERRR